MVQDGFANPTSRLRDKDKQGPKDEHKQRRYQFFFFFDNDDTLNLL